MPHAWSVRDRLVLDAIVRCWDARPADHGPTYQTIADAVTFDLDTVSDCVAHLAALEVVAICPNGPVDNWQVRAIAPDARSIVRRPVAEELYATRLLRVLEQAADEAVEGSSERLKLQRAAYMMSNLGRETLIHLCAKVLGAATRG